MLARGSRRSKRAGRIAFVLAAAILSSPATAQQSACPPSRSPIKLNFKTLAPTPTYSHRLNLNGIAARSRSPGARTEASSRPVGLTSVSTMFELKGATSIVRRGQTWCSYLASVDVNFGWDNMQVFIPSEYHQASCEYRAVMDHENQHVSIIRSALKEFSPIARARVEQVMAKSRPIPGAGEGSVDQALAPIKAELEGLLLEFNEMHGARSAIIDTPSNYRATTALCRNWDGQGR
ncbi:MAG: hypothetical protein AB7E79_09110 [Rhodospirillaceae bacterium]